MAARRRAGGDGGTAIDAGAGSEAGSRVGVRELRQNLSVYLDRVKDGETLVVTEHGRPVAQLIPNPPAIRSVLDRLVREGRATPGAGDRRRTPLPPSFPGRPLSEILAEMREGERW